MSVDEMVQEYRGAGGSDEGGNYMQNMYTSLVRGTKAAGQFPTEEDDYDYYDSFPEYRVQMDRYSDRILSLARGLMEQVLVYLRQTTQISHHLCRFPREVRLPLVRKMLWMQITLSK